MKKSLILLCAALTAACAGGPQDGPTLSGLNRSDFQSEADGKKTDLFVLKNDNGMEVCVTNFGGRIVSVMVPGRDGVMRDVVLGFDKVADYQTIPSDFGATIGRYANRIAQGRITLDGTEYQLPQNNYGHCLHGGPRGFQYRVFDAVQKSDRELELTYASKDGEEGFPGNFECRVTMTLTDDNAIDIRYAAETEQHHGREHDQPLLFQPRRGPREGQFGMAADGERRQLYAGRFDLHDHRRDRPGGGHSDGFPDPDARRRTHRPGFRAASQRPRHRPQLGAEHPGRHRPRRALRWSRRHGHPAGCLHHRTGIQVYCGNFLDGSVKGKKGAVYGFRSAVCLETQKYPDTPNKPEWPSAVLRPGEKYESRCIYKFSVGE